MIKTVTPPARKYESGAGRLLSPPRVWAAAGADVEHNRDKPEEGQQFPAGPLRVGTLGGREPRHREGYVWGYQGGSIRADNSPWIRNDPVATVPAWTCEDGISQVGPAWASKRVGADSVVWRER